MRGSPEQDRIELEVKEFGPIVEANSPYRARMSSAADTSLL